MRATVLADERTALAWNRTALGLVGACALLLRFTSVASVPVIGEVVAVAALLAAALVWWYGRHSYRATARSAIPVCALAITVSVLALASAAAVTTGLA